MNVDTTATHTETVRAVGHEHVSATHQSTFEVTTDDWLTPAGDCIIGIKANRTPADFDDQFVNRVRAGAKMTVVLFVGEPNQMEVTPATAAVETTIDGRGDDALTFDSDRSLVCRTSSYTDDRTVMVSANAAAADLPRDAISRLAAGAPLLCRLHVEALG